MKLPEAIALMLEGKVMMNGDSSITRLVDASDGRRSKSAQRYRAVESYDRHMRDWFKVTDPWLAIDGWREATPEELKEIGL